LLRMAFLAGWARTRRSPFVAASFNGINLTAFRVFLVFHSGLVDRWPVLQGWLAKAACMAFAGCGETC
jgi:hypothetical protein